METKFQIELSNGKQVTVTDNSKINPPFMTSPGGNSAIGGSNRPLKPDEWIKNAMKSITFIGDDGIDYNSTAIVSVSVAVVEE